MTLLIDNNIIFVIDLGKLTLTHLTVVYIVLKHSIVGIVYLLTIILKLGCQ